AGLPADVRGHRALRELRRGSGAEAGRGRRRLPGGLPLCRHLRDDRPRHRAARRVAVLRRRRDPAPSQGRPAGAADRRRPLLPPSLADVERPAHCAGDRGPPCAVALNARTTGRGYDVTYDKARVIAQARPTTYDAVEEVRRVAWREGVCAAWRPP